MIPSLLLRRSATAAPARACKSTFLSDLPGLIDKTRIQCGVPGMSVAVLHKNELVFADGFGKRNEKNEPFTPETLSPIASVTKAFTAMALGQLVAEGKMDWDTTPIKFYLPEFTLKDPVLTSQLTLVDLLSHRTGVPGDVSLPFLCSKAPLNELLSRLQYSNHPSKLGAKTIYNNAMYTVAGEAGARVAGMSYEDLVRKKVLEPLGLHNSGFFFDEMSAKSPDNYAQPFVTASFEAAQRGEFTQIEHDEYKRLSAAGSMYSNVLDLVRWGKTVLDLGQLDGKQVLDKESVEQVLKPYTIMDRPRRSADFAPALTYGLGWTIDSYKGQTLYWHDGGLQGVSSYLGIMPDSDLVVATISNRLPVQFGPCFHYMMADELLNLPTTKDWAQISVEGTKSDTDFYIGLGTGNHLPERIPDKPMTHPLSAFEGRYTHPFFETISVRREGDKLFVTVWDTEYLAEHYHEDVFFVKMTVASLPSAALLEFKTHADGSIVALTALTEEKENNIDFTKQ